MITVLMNTNMEKDLLIYKDELCIPMPLVKGVREYLDSGLVMIDGGCFYELSASLPNEYDTGDEIEFTQWKDNHVHSDVHHDNYRMIGAWEVSQGMSLLIATYNEIRQKGYEGRYRFNLSYNQGEPFFDDCSGTVPSCTVRFYRDLGDPMWPFRQDELNAFQKECVLEFESEPLIDGEINTLVMQDDCWYLTYNEEPAQSSPAPRIAAFENAPWMANWTYVNEGGGLSYAFISEAEGEQTFRSNPNQGLERLGLILSAAQKMAASDQVRVNVEMDATTVEAIADAFHMSNDYARKIGDMVSDQIESLNEHFEVTEAKSWNEVSSYIGQVRACFEAGLIECDTDLRNLFLNLCDEVLSLSQDVYDDLLAEGHDHFTALQISAHFADIGVFSLDTAVGYFYVSIPVVFLRRDANTSNLKGLYQASLEADMLNAIVYAVVTNYESQSERYDAVKPRSLFRILRLLVDNTSIGEVYAYTSLLKGRTNRPILWSCG